MKNKKWIKWFVGLGSVSSVAVLFSLIQGEKEELTKPSEQFVQSPLVKIDTTSDEITNISTLKEKEMKAREEWITTLDWDEGNWDVEETEVGMTYLPKETSKGFTPSEVRTRRS